MSEPGSYEHELARGVGRAATHDYLFQLPREIAEKVSHDDLRQIVMLGATMLASDTPLRILLRRMQAIRTFEQEGA